MVVISDSLDQLSAQELRELLAGLMTKVAQQDQQIAKLDQTISIDAKELVYRQTKIDQLTHEMAVLKRHRFGRSREQLDSTQASLLEEAFDEDLAAIEQELKNLTPPPKADTQPPKKPKRTALPADLPRVDVHHEPDSTACQCGCQLKRIGEDVSEKQIARIYDIERETKGLPPDERQRIRQEKSKPLLDALQQWMILNRQKIMDGSATAKALDYSLRRWGALTRFVGNGQLPIDNNHIENQIRPIAIGRGNWLFAGSLRAGQRAAAVMSLIQSAKLNGHDPYASLKDVLTRLPTQRNSMIGELLPHRWTPPTASP